jgi:hypothetical protein
VNLIFVGGLTMKRRNSYQTLTTRERVTLQRRQEKERLLAQKVKSQLVYEPVESKAKPQQLGFSF